jgi:hypothetical protein
MSRRQPVMQSEAPCCGQDVGPIRHTGDRIPDGTTAASVLLKRQVQLMPSSLFAMVVCFGRHFERGAHHDAPKLSRVVSRAQLRCISPCQ